VLASMVWSMEFGLGRKQLDKVAEFQQSFNEDTDFIDSGSRVG